DSPVSGRRTISIGPTPGCTNDKVSGLAPVVPLKIMPAYVLVESEFHAEFTVPVPVGEYAGVGPPIELPSFGLTVRLRHAGCPASQPFGAVGIRMFPVRPCAVVLAPFAS